jgi:hypothetical protein
MISEETSMMSLYFPPQSGEIERFEDAVVLSQECYKIV